MRKGILTGVGLIIGLVAIAAVFLWNNSRSYVTQNVLDIPAAFTDASEWKNGVLTGKDMLIYEDDGLRLWDMKTGKGSMLCTKTGCKHNSDDCMSRFSSNVSISEIYSYEQKLYLIGNSQNAIILYRCDMDGSNHEEVCNLSPDKGAYGTIAWTSYLRDKNGIYIAVTVNDESNMEVLEDGSMSDVPGMARLFYLDLSTKKFTKLHDFNPCYQCFLNLKYLIDDTLCFTFEGDESPYEELYDLNGKLVKEDKTALSYVGIYQISKKAVHEIKDGMTGSLVGQDGSEIYVAEITDGKLTGNILGLDRQGHTKSTFSLDMIKNLSAIQARVSLLEDGFVVNIQKEEDSTDGKIIFLDHEGRKLQTVEHCQWFISGEYEDTYLLSRNVVTGWVRAYIPKNAITNFNKKAVSISEDQ